MATAWERYHRRAAMLRLIRERIEHTRDGVLPWNETIAEVFAGQRDLLAALHQVWSNHLAARVETALETADGDVRERVAQARQDLADQFPGLRRVLDRHAGNPALAHPRRVEQRLLAVAAGLATLDQPAERAAHTGARLADTTPRAS